MELSKQNAMSIVTEISGIIGQHVNMMDKGGHIIASTDPMRIGTYHGGAALLVEERRDELVIDNDFQHEGSRQGLNLPLVLNGEFVGVLGITGEYGEILKYGQIIKKMTETMMQENYQNQQKKIDDRIQSRFLDEWVLDGVPVTAGMVERGARLGIDVGHPYRVMVAVLTEFRRYSDTAEGQVLIDNINRRVRRIMEEEAGGIFAKTATKMICLWPGGDISDDDMREKASSLIQTIYQELGIRLSIGIDGVAEGVHQAYQQASKAVQGCTPGKKDICLYDTISLEIFLDEIPPHLRQVYVRRIFRNCSEKEIAQLVAMLQVYFEANGSIGKTADRLFVHKNTLQYKLRKVSEKTGHDPRQLTDSALIYLAIQFYLADEAV